MQTHTVVQYRHAHTVYIYMQSQIFKIKVETVIRPHLQPAAHAYIPTSHGDIWRVCCLHCIKSSFQPLWNLLLLPLLLLPLLQLLFINRYVQLITIYYYYYYYQFYCNCFLSYYNYLWGCNSNKYSIIQYYPKHTRCMSVFHIHRLYQSKYYLILDFCDSVVKKAWQGNLLYRKST